MSKFDLQSWLTGFALGLAGKAVPIAAREPVAFLYNGTQLPALPEQDNPYAVITGDADGSGQYYLWISSTPIVYTVYINLPYGVPQADGKMIKYRAASADLWDKYEGYDSWTLSSEIELTADTKTGFGYPQWANYDVLNYDDGAVYLSASDPVPVYE